MNGMPPMNLGQFPGLQGDSVLDNIQVFIEKFSNYDEEGNGAIPLEKLELAIADCLGGDSGMAS